MTGIILGDSPHYHAWAGTCHRLESAAGSAQWDLAIPADGEYTMQVWLPAAPNAGSWARNAIYEIVSGGSTIKAVTLDQSAAAGGDGWHTIAKANLTAASGSLLRVRNGGAGSLIADAVYVTSTALYNDGTPATQVTLGAYDGILLQRAAAVGSNYQGLWWNPHESGWGINFAHQGDIIFATWFTYDAAGKPWWLIAELHKTAEGVYSGAVSTVAGPLFNSSPFGPAPVETQVGTMTATFADAKHATIAYTVNGISQTKAIVPQEFGPLPTCTWGAQPNLALATNYTDLWWNANESGWGINFTHQGDIIFATWFTYDAAGKPWWLIAELHKGAARRLFGPVSTVSGRRSMRCRSTRARSWRRPSAPRR